SCGCLIPGAPFVVVCAEIGIIPAFIDPGPKGRQLSEPKHIPDTVHTVTEPSMLNRYPLWKYLLILGVIVLAFIYAIPNIYPADPAVQISGQSSSVVIDENLIKRVEDTLEEAGIGFLGTELNEAAALVRLQSEDQQMQARR